MDDLQSECESYVNDSVNELRRLGTVEIVDWLVNDWRLLGRASEPAPRRRVDRRPDW